MGTQRLEAWKKISTKQYSLLRQFYLQMIWRVIWLLKGSVLAN